MSSSEELDYSEESSESDFDDYSNVLPAPPILMPPTPMPEPSVTDYSFTPISPQAASSMPERLIISPIAISPENIYRALPDSPTPPPQVKSKVEPPQVAPERKRGRSERMVSAQDYRKRLEKTSSRKRQLERAEIPEKKSSRHSANSSHSSKKHSQRERTHDATYSETKEKNSLKPRISEEISSKILPNTRKDSRAPSNTCKMLPSTSKDPPPEISRTAFKQPFPSTSKNLSDPSTNENNNLKMISESKNDFRNFKIPLKRNHVEPTDNRTFQPNYHQSYHRRRPEYKNRYMREYSGRHKNCLAVLCIRRSGFTITNGSDYHTADGEVNRQKLLEKLHQMKVFTLICTEEDTRLKFKELFADLPPYHFTKTINIKSLDSSATDKIGSCMSCYGNDCHRWIAVAGGIAQVLHAPIDPIMH